MMLQLLSGGEGILAASKPAEFSKGVVFSTAEVREARFFELKLDAFSVCHLDEWCDFPDGPSQGMEGDNFGFFLLDHLD